MKQLSIWAKNHPHAARFLIIFTHFLMGFGGAELGLWLYAQGIQLPRMAFFLLLAVFLTAYILYPLRKRNATAAAAGGYAEYPVSNYVRRKSLDGILLCSMALLWLTAGNRLPDRFLITPAASGQTIAIPARQSNLELAKEAPASDWMQKSKHKMGLAQKWFSRRIEKQLKRYAGNSGGEVALILILGVLLTLTLAYLTLVFACTLSCAGNDFEAILVVVLGAGMIAGLWVLLAKWMRKTRKQGVW